MKKLASHSLYAVNDVVSLGLTNKWAGKYAITIAPHLAEEAAETVLRQLAVIPPPLKSGGSLTVS
jgi:hypothetical protein